MSRPAPARRGQAAFHRRSWLFLSEACGSVIGVVLVRCASPAHPHDPKGLPVSTFRLSSPSDCVAGAVALGGHIPVDEVVVIALDLEPMPVAMIKLTDVESGRVLANLEGATPFAQCSEMLVVVFGPVERGDAVGEVFEQFRPDAVTPVYVFTEGVVRRWHGVGSLALQAGDQMDLRSHPIVLEASHSAWPRCRLVRRCAQLSNQLSSA